MSRSIVRQLIVKDLRLMRTYILLYWFAGIASIAFVMVLNSELAGTVGFILFVGAMAAAGIHAIFLTIVEEKEKLNLPFIMSLPVSLRQYSMAKISANLLIFGSVWLTLSAASLVVFIGEDGMPRGMLPFVSIMLVAIFAAYILMLSTALITASQGYTIFSTVVANLGVQGYLWWVGDLYPIRAVKGGAEAIWNTTTVTVLVAQCVFIVAVIMVTLMIQLRRKDVV